ncbi:hypothetical protein [uncultured Thalassospira sp.]|uniref:hypothetical protein n=1 Tax=uncultured Thalassospira sp. TaxID=404382 RepID=UPI0030D85377
MIKSDRRPGGHIKHLWRWVRHNKGSAVAWACIGALVIWVPDWKYLLQSDTGDVPHKFYVTERLSGQGSFGSAIFWIDNSRVFYSGYNSNSVPKTQEQQRALSAQGDKLFLWTVGQREMTYPVRENPEHNPEHNPAFCAGLGRIKYSAERNKTQDQVYVYQGPVGEEEKIEIRSVVRPAEERYGFNAAAISYADCSIVVNEYNKKLNRRWKPFAPGEGFLLFGDYGDDDPRNAKLDVLHPESGELIHLDISGSEAWHSCTRYNPFLKGLMTWNCMGYTMHISPDDIWKKTNCYAIWAVWPDGRSRKYCLPFGEWSKVYADIVPVITAKGIFFFWAGGPASYLVTDDGVAHLVRRGTFQKPAVSPDGCKVAGNYAKSWRDGDWITGNGGQHAAVIDLCADPGEGH